MTYKNFSCSKTLKSYGVSILIASGEPHSSRVLHISINKIISAFDDVVQVELLKTRWGEIKLLQS